MRFGGSGFAAAFVAESGLATGARAVSALIWVLVMIRLAASPDTVTFASVAGAWANAGALRAHPELSLAIQGYADPRGADADNRELSGRRAATVRDILADSGVADDRMLVRQFGASSRVSTGTTALYYARDRRVQLVFVLPNGEELPISESTALDLQIERVVKRSAALRRRPGVRRVVKAP